jgi:hypothetical protein
MTTVWVVIIEIFLALLIALLGFWFGMNTERFRRRERYREKVFDLMCRFLEAHYGPLNDLIWSFYVFISGSHSKEELQDLKDKHEAFANLYLARPPFMPIELHSQLIELIQFTRNFVDYRTYGKEVDVAQTKEQLDDFVINITNTARDRYGVEILMEDFPEILEKKKKFLGLLERY